MTFFKDLEEALASESDGFSSVNIQVPSPLTGGKWIVNKRFGECAWARGKPCDTLQEAMTKAFRKSPAAICSDLI